MAKKKVEIINKSLTPTVLAKVKDQKFNPSRLIVLFLIFGSFVYFLPYLTKAVDKYMHPEKYQDVEKPNPVVDEEKPNSVIDAEKPNSVTDEKKYTYSGDLVIDVDGYKLKDFNIKDNKLTFNVVKVEEVKNLKTILELYNNKNELLEHFAINVNVEKDETKSLIYDIKDSNVEYFQIKKE